MNNVWVGTDWHLWSVNSVTDKRHQFKSISNLGRLSDAYAEDIQSDDIFIYLGDLCDPGVTDIKKLKAIVSSIPGYKVLCKGNHDTQDDTFYREIGFDVVCEICVIHNLVFSHKPVRVPMGYLNIHGHLHTEKMSTLGYQHINAYDSNFFERPMLVDDLIDSAAFQSPEEYAGTDLKHVEEKFEKYTSVENDTYTQIVDLTDMVGLYPVDEAAIDRKDDTATDPLDEVLFSDITDVQYWENDDDAPKKKKVKQSPLDTDNQGVVAESTTAMNTFPFIFLSQENMNDELYPEGKMLLRNMDDAVRELYLYQRPVGEYYVHNTEPGYYRLIMSPEFSAGYFSTDTINLSAVGKIRVNADYSWEWIEKYDSDMNESEGLGSRVYQLTEAFFPGADIPLHYAENNIQKTAIQEIKSLIKSNKFKGLNPKPYSIEKNTIIIELVGGSQDERESHKSELAVIAKELKDVLTVKYSNEVKTVTNGDGDEGCIYIKLKKNVDMTINETTSNKFSAAKSSLKVNTSLYFISKDRLDEAEIIHPRIPDNYMTQHGYEDNKTPRISFSTSIDGCLMGLGKNVSNQVFYVYQPVGKYKVITPTIDQVPDVKITKERWICEPVKLIRVGKIRAIDENGPHDDGIPYVYGKNGEHEARLYHWGWKWIKQFKYDLNESATFNQVKRIVSNIPKEEHHWFYHGDEFKDSPYVKYRDVMYLKNGRGKTIGGFIDVYSFDSDPDTGIVVIALEPGARGTGLATKLVQKALKKLPSLGITKVIWRADIDNIASQKLAKKLGFTDISDLKANPDQYKYEYVLNEMYLNSLSAAVEDTTELHEMSPKDKQAIANKYGLRTPGEYQQDGQDKTQERVNQRREKQLKDLKKARKIKKRKAFVRKVKSHLPGAQNESAMGILSMPKVVSSPPFDIDDKVDLYVGLANKKINEYGKTAKNIPVPKRKFKKNPNKNRAVPDYYLKLWFNPDRASNLLINDAAPNQHTIWLYPDEYCTLMFVCADGVCRVYMLDSYIAGDYYQFLGSFQVDMGIGAKLKAALKEDSSGVDDSESDHYEADAIDRDPLWGDRNHFFKHPNAAEEDYDKSIQENYKFEPVDKNLKFVDRLDEAASNSSKSHVYTEPLYRITYNDIGIYEAYKKACSFDEWRSFINSDAATWLDVPKIYNKDINHTSYFTKRGYELFQKNTYPVIIQKLNKRNIKVDQVVLDVKPVYEDLYQVVVPNSVNESSIQDSYQFELLDKSVHFYDKIDEAASYQAKGKLYPVYVVLVHSGTGVSKAIKAISHSEYSHASICFDSSLDKMYSFARKDPRNPFIGGFRYESIGKGFYEQKEIPYAVYVVPCTENQVKKMKKRLNYFIQNQEKFTFDFTGLVTNYLGIVNNPAHRWFCSRFVADVLNAGAPKNNPYVAEPSLQDPDDFKDTDWAIYVDSGENLMKYDRKKVDRKTNQIIRKEMLRRMAVNESAIFDLDAFNPFIESTLNYQFAMMDEAAVDDFVRYLKSFKVKFDKEGNVIISRREVDQLDKHFRQSLRMIKAYENAGDLDSVKLELCKINYMIELINEYYLSPKAMKSKRVKTDLRKEMLDLRSVMLNAFSQHLKYVKTIDPAFNFKSYYDTSIYGKNIEIPKPVLTAIGKAIVTQL